MEFDINKYIFLLYKREYKIPKMHIWKTSVIIPFYPNYMEWRSKLSFIDVRFFHSKNMSLILDVKVFIESLTKNINFEVNLSFISFNV